MTNIIRDDQLNYPEEVKERIAKLEYEFKEAAVRADLIVLANMTHPTEIRPQGEFNAYSRAFYVPGSLYSEFHPKKGEVIPGYYEQLENEFAHAHSRGFKYVAYHSADAYMTIKYVPMSDLDPVPEDNIVYNYKVRFAIL